jgi:Cytochrome c biogenesis factor
VVLLTGVAINVSYKVESRLAGVAVGQSSAVGDYIVTLRSLTTDSTPERSTIIGTFDVRGTDGKDLGTVDAEKSFFAGRDQPATEVGILSTPTADIYIILSDPDPAAQVAAVSYLVNPGMYWVWLGALIVVIGGIVVGWPQRRRRLEPKEVPDETEELVEVGAYA